MALPLAAELLDFADDIVRAPPAQPAALRRAASAAYYAVFHELIRVAVQRVLGDDPAHEEDWRVAGRWYSHSDVKVVSSWVAGQRKGQKVPKFVETFLDAPSAELVALTAIVCELQEARVKADYVLSATLELDDVRDLVGDARVALKLLGNLGHDRVSDNYLMLLLGGPRMPGRQAS